MRTYTPILSVLCALLGAFAPIGAKIRRFAHKYQIADGELLYRSAVSIYVELTEDIHGELSFEPTNIQ